MFFALVAMTFLAQATPVQEVYGRVVVEGGGPAPQLWIGFNAAAADTMLFGLSGTPTRPFGFGGCNRSELVSFGCSVSPSPTGAFRIALPTGKTTVAVGLVASSPYTVKSFTYDDLNLLQEPIDLPSEPNASLKEIQIVVSPRVSTVKLSGRILGLDSAMAQNAALRLFGFRQFAAPIETRARPDGSFLFPRVFPGEYTLRLAGAAPDNISAPELAVTIGDSDVEGVVIEAPRLKKVHGRMTVEGRGPAPRFTLSLKSEAQSGAPKYGHFEINPGRDGTFNVVLPEGSWEVAEQSLRVGYILQSLMYGEHDLMRGPLNLAMDDPAAELRISVKAPEDSGVTIAGRVVGASSGAEGRPVAVTLRSPSFTEDLSAAVSGDGTFVFPVVYPARYLAIVRVSGKSAPGSDQIVEFSDLPVRDLEMRVPARSRFKGTIDVRGGAPPPRVSIPLFPAHVEPLLMPRFLNDEPLFRPTLEFDPLRDEGFSVDLPEGEYLLDPTAFELPPGYGIDSFTYGTTDLLKENLRVTRADTTTLRLTLRRN